MLYHQRRGPEGVDEPFAASGEALGSLLEYRHPAAIDPKDVEPLVPERLCLGPFSRLAAPLGYEGVGARADLVPRKRSGRGHEAEG